MITNIRELPQEYDKLQSEHAIVVVDTIRNCIIARIYDNGMAEAITPYEVRVQN